MVELVVVRFVGCGDRCDLGPDLREAGADLLVGEGDDLGLERVRLVDEGLDPLQLAVIGVDEARKETQHGRCSLAEVPRNGGRRPPDPLPAEACAIATPQPASDQNPVP